MLLIDEKHWLKAGIEFNDDQPMIGSVLTNEVSDWAAGTFNHIFGSALFLATPDFFQK